MTAPRNRASILAQRGWRSLVAGCMLTLGVAALVVVPSQPAGADTGGTVTYTATIDIPAPPASNFSGATSGDGWAVALSSTAVYNVFHHQQSLQVDCHLQANAAQTSPCWGGSDTITASDASAFYTSAQPGLYLDQSSGHLFVFVTHPEDDTAGVACIDTTQAPPVLCGYTPLTPVGQGPPTSSSISGTSDPVQVGTNWYAFNYVNSGTPTGAEDELMCFSLTTFQACSDQPYAVDSGLSGVSVSPEPSPSIAAIGGQVVIPVADGGTTTLACYDPSVAGGSCGGSWPISTGLDYEGSNGAPFPLLDPSSAAVTGLCLPTGTNPCYDLDGASTATPSGLNSTTMPADTGWNGPAVTVGPRVYVANQNSSHSVYCFDYSADAECADFPKSFSGINNGPYTVNPDPQRPTCVWINSDSGTSQIQNFDAFTAGSCGQGPIRLQASNFVAPPAECAPTNWTSLQITSPTPPTTYGGGSLEFENSDGGALAVTPNPVDLDSTGSVDLTGYDFSTVSNLPDFVITMNSPPSDLSDVTVQASWQGVNSSSCSQPGTSVSGSVGLAGGSGGVGTNQALTATVTAADSPVDDASVTFACVSGPCTTTTGTATTDSTGTATFSYASAVTGTDVWQASYTPSGGTIETSEDAAVIWTEVPTSFTASAAPSLTTYGNTVTLSESGLPGAATGTVTFSSGGTTLCTVMLSSATSCSTGVLPPGTYPVSAAYSGDGTYLASNESSAFAITRASTSASASVSDASTGLSWSGSETPGAAAYVTATISTSGSSASVSGSATYDIYGNDNCSGEPLQVSTASVSAGSAGQSATTAPLGAGTYSVQATYGGSSDYDASASACVPFSVGKSAASLTSAVDDNGTGTSWSGSEVTGASALGTSTISGAPGFAPTGTVTYTLFSGGTCSGSQLQSDSVTISDASVPTSTATAALGAGTYSYGATYSGDGNYGAGSGPCAPFTVGLATPTVHHAVDDVSTGTAWTGSEVTGARAEDTSSVTGVTGFTPSGSVQYTLFAGTTCSGEGIQTSTGTLNDGVVGSSSPSEALAAGTYSYQAAYSGDGNYTTKKSACTNFTVVKDNPAVVNAVDDAAHGSAWSGAEVTGAQADDTSTVDGVSGFTPTGNVQYSLFSGGTCSGEPLQTSTEGLSAGIVPTSATSAALAPASYSYEAAYLGDGNYAVTTSSCASFSVAKSALPGMGQVVDDASTTSPWTGSEATGSAAYDTATLTGIEGFVPTGTVTYSLFGNDTCSGETGNTETVNISDGSVPNSSTTAPLMAGSYSYRTQYSGDGDYEPSTGDCAPLSVSKAPRMVGAVVDDAGTGQAWNGAEVTGASAYDTAVLGNLPDPGGIVPTGTVAYDLFANATCSGSPTSANTVNVIDGVVPDGPASGPLAAGSYASEALYSGDANYQSAAGSCQPFTVGRAPTSAVGSVFDAGTHQAWTGGEYQGASAYDTATVSGVAAFAPTGTVTYRFFRSSSCAGSPASSQTVPLSGGNVPTSSVTGGLPPSSFSYQVAYGGDARYLSSTGACERFKTQVTGYRIEGGDGGIFAYGTPFMGSTPHLGLRILDFVGMATTSNGYWLVQSNGGVFSFGGAQFYGSLPSTGVSVDDVVGIVATSDGMGYWIVTSGGNVYAFGDAVFHGSLPAVGVHVDDVVGVVSHDAGGYWLVGRDGGVFSFGDAAFHGSCIDAGSGCQGVSDVVGMVSDDAGGYWLVGRDGGVFSFGDAPFHGSCISSGSGCQGVHDVVGIASPDAGGYWLAGADGAVYAFGDAQFQGSKANSPLVMPIVAIN